MATSMKSKNFDLKEVVSENKFIGLWRLMSGYRWIYLLATMSLGVAAFSKTATYLLIRHFIDNILDGETDSSQAILIGLGFVGLALIQGCFSYLSGRLAAETAEGIVLRLRNYLYDQIQRLPFRYHDRTQTGEIIQRATSDVDALARFFGDQAIQAGRIILLFLVNFAALLQLHVGLAFFSIIIVPVIVALSLFFFTRVSRAYEKYQEQEAKLSTTLQENLVGVRVVKAFARQQFERQKFEGDNWEKFQRGRKLLSIHSVYWPLTDILCGAQMLSGFYFGAALAIRDEISLGTYLAYAGLLIWIIWPMRNLGRLIVQMSTGLVSFGRVMDLIKEDREPVDVGRTIDLKDLKGEVIFKEADFEYESDNPVLKKISFHARPGDTIALLGPSGSGKTSLVNLLMRFYDYSSGLITIDGMDVKELSRSFLRKHIGIVEQEPFLFSTTIAANISFGISGAVSHDQVEAVAKAAAIHSVIMSFPDQYQTMVGEKGVTLSGGQKQRIAIARTLLKDPEILILDDCTSSVDMETEVHIRQALDKLMQNRTTFIIAHRIQSVMEADQILVLDDGCIVQHGSHADLMDQEGMYKEIFRIQTRIEEEIEREIASV